MKYLRDYPVKKRNEIKQLFIHFRNNTKEEIDLITRPLTDRLEDIKKVLNNELSFEEYMRRDKIRSNQIIKLLCSDEVN